MKKILITGCSGYIGSHLCKLLKGKYIIHGLDLNDPRQPIDTFFNGDICDDYIDNFVDIYQKVNDIKINVKNGHRREGGAESTVLKDVSKYMKTLYATDDLLKI